MRCHVRNHVQAGLTRRAERRDRTDGGARWRKRRVRLERLARQDRLEELLEGLNGRKAEGGCRRGGVRGVRGRGVATAAGRGGRRVRGRRWRHVVVGKVTERTLGQQQAQRPNIRCVAVLEALYALGLWKNGSKVERVFETTVATDM